MYVDADFAGLFRREPVTSQDSVRSRTGYIIFLGPWPLVWKSMLQSHLSQSTLESEYSALSHALKTLLPLKWLIQEMLSQVGTAKLRSTVIKATVFEDNQSALYLATNQRITSRTKYFLTKWHWFWSHYPKEFSILKCESSQMLADWLTKPLSRDKFQANRLAVIGW